MGHKLKLTLLPVMVNSSPTTTDQLIELWLYGRSPNTIDSYKHHVQGFFTHVNKPLEKVTCFGYSILAVKSVWYVT